jgi:hypothetical protein
MKRKKAAKKYRQPGKTAKKHFAPPDKTSGATR